MIRLASDNYKTYDYPASGKGSHETTTPLLWRSPSPNSNRWTRSVRRLNQLESQRLKSTCKGPLKINNFEFKFEIIQIATIPNYVYLEVNPQPPTLARARPRRHR